MNGVDFLHQIKHKVSGAWEKGIVVKDQDPDPVKNYEAAKQSYHAYLGAYAYGHDADSDYVACYITNEDGARMMWEIWNPAPEPAAEV